ncbi:MAG: hypothetical protein ACLQPD_27090 [Desulfomonilaceae bacterium]
MKSTDSKSIQVFDHPNQVQEFLNQIPADKLIGVVIKAYKIGSPAIRLYLWLLMNQEGEARRNRFQVELTDTEVADALNVNKSTIGRYRRHLVRMGLLSANGNVWIAKIQ